MFKPIQVADPVKASDINRIQQNVLAWANETGDAGDGTLSVLSLTTTPSATSYLVHQEDKYIVVDASAGDFSISLPAPTVKQAVTIIPAAGKVTVQRNDGQAVAGQGVHSLTGNGATFVSTGKTWVKM